MERNKLIYTVGDKCENPNCNHTYSLDVHHIIPRSKGIKAGGTNKLKNLIVLCPTCHRAAERGAYSPSRLRVWISRKRRFRHPNTIRNWKW